MKRMTNLDEDVGGPLIDWNVCVWRVGDPL